jgi:putative ABC transport system permease protein
MTFLSGILHGLDEVWAHKLRSALTIICVLLGVASLVIIAGFIAGLFQSSLDWLAESGGLEKVSIQAEDMGPTEPAVKRTWQEVEAVSALARHARRVSPEATLGRSTSLRRRGKTVRPRLRGVTSAAFFVDRLTVESGRILTDLDVARANSVAVLGSDIVGELFKKGEDPLGAIVVVSGLPCEVVGVLKRYEIQTEGGPISMGEKNRLALIPITAMQHKLNGNSDLAELNIQIDDPNRMRSSVDELTNILSTLHGGKKVADVSTNESMLQQLESMKRNFLMVGGGIGTITLLVGGIGIMNLMLASINERFREIGVRKALGAKRWNIFLQFLAEAVALSMLGGAVGALLGCGVIKALQGPLEKYAPPQISPMAIAVGFGFSVLTGLLAGLYPALRAARLDPIAALRYE